MKGHSLLLVATFVATACFSASAESQLSLEQRITQLEQQNQTSRQIQSQMSIQLTELQKEVKELRGIIEEHDFKLQQMQERQRDIYRDIEDRFSAMPQTSATNTQAVTSPQDNTATANNNASTNTVTTPAISSSDGRSEFEAAFKLVRSKQYIKAISGFESFLQKYPNSDYSDNARFWIGQIYFAQSKLSDAEKQFLQLRNDFPQSSKVSAAILKLAEIKAKQQQWEQARALYNEVLNGYTGAPQQLARKGLQALKQAGH